MTSTVRCWLVDRSFDDGRIITTTYATSTGEEIVTRQRAIAHSDAGVPVSIEVSRSALSPVTDEAEQQRYLSEVKRVRGEYDADETV